MTYGSLFAGIGGMDLGLERAGLTCKWQCEIDDYPTRVLTKHWPDVPKFRDVRAFPPRPESEWTRHRWKERFGVDLICGGFPCQDISSAGKRTGITGKRSGLWSEFARIVRVLRPGFVLVENSADLPLRGLDVVLGNLAALGYDAEWEVLAASDYGAPHIRERTFVLANALRERTYGEHRRSRQTIDAGRNGPQRLLPDPEGQRERLMAERQRRQEQTETDVDGNGAIDADVESQGSSVSGRGVGATKKLAGHADAVGWPPEPDVD